MSKSKIISWLNDNVVILVSVPLIVGIHWGWSRLQVNAGIQSPDSKKQIPIVAAYHAYKEKFFGDTKTLKEIESIKGDKK